MLEYLDDLEADFLAIYGVNMLELEAPRFFRLAERIFAFQGVLHARLQHEQSQTNSSARTRSPGADHPAAQRVNLLSQGGEVSTTKLEGTSYLHDLLKGAQ